MKSKRQLNGNKTIIKRMCPVCHRAFVPSRPWHIYDSKECGRLARAKRRAERIARALAEMEARIERLL